MTHDERIALIEQARVKVAAAAANCDLPQIEAILKSADMELHWALWNLGVPVSLRPEWVTGGAGTGEARL